MDIKNIIKILERKSSIPNDNESWEDIDKAYDDAIHILTRDIPMKPQEINEERIRLDGIWEWSCGNCGRFHRNDYPLNYCNECGQKVDWSELE